MPSYTYRKLIKKLKKLGFRKYRQGKGSHVLWVRDEDGIVVPVPFHASKDIRSGTLRAICKEIGLKNVQELDEI